MKKDTIKETDLYMPVRNLFTGMGYDVRSEVMGCDLTAINGSTLIVAELKLSMNLQLILQATRRQKIAEKVYCAILRPGSYYTSRWRDIFHLLRRLEIGLIFVNFSVKGGHAEIILEAESFDRNRSMASSKKKRAKVIKESNSRKSDLNSGGSVKKKLITAYREKAVYIALLLNKYGPLSVRELRDKGADEAKTQQILYRNVYGWFIRKKRGVYDINDRGNKALVQFEELVSIIRREE